MYRPQIKQTVLAFPQTRAQQEEDGVEVREEDIVDIKDNQVV
jgi:hypothetical protein